MNPFRYSFLRPWDSFEDQDRISPYRNMIEEKPITFPTMEVPSLAAPVSSEPKSLMSDYLTRMMEPSEDQRKLLEHIRATPKEADFKPGKMNRLAAILSGVSEGWQRGAGAGVGIASDILQQPYERALRRHEIEGRGLKAAADISTNMMENQARVLKTMEDARLNQQKYLLDVQEAQERFKNGQSTREVNAARIDQIKQSMKQSGYREQKNETDGHTYMINPWTGDSIDLGKHSLTPDEKSTIKKEEFKYEEGIRFDNQKALQNDRQSHDEEMEKARQTNRVALQTLRSNAPNSQAFSNNVTKARAAANNLISTDPNAFTNAGVSVENGNIVFKDPPKDKTGAAYAKYVAAFNAYFKNIPGAVLMSMPKGFNEYGVQGDEVDMDLDK